MPSIFCICSLVRKFEPMYSHYKPLRNYLAKKGLFHGLVAVWQDTRNYQIAKTQNALHDPSRHALPWELELLARELIINGELLVPSTTKKSAIDISEAVNHVRSISERISEQNIKSTEDAIVAILPLLHQQLPWSGDNHFARIIRYARIMGNPIMANAVEEHLHISVTDLLKIGFAVAGALQNKPVVHRSNYSLTPGIAPDAENVFFALTAEEIGVLRKETKARQSYDRRWAYTYNPLRGKPLVYDKRNPDILYGPVPQLMLWRITDGLYYDLICQKDILKAFATAYEHYIGDVLHTALGTTGFKIIEETTYHVGKDKRAGADWHISDSTGHVFVECKMKRLTLPAKASGDGEEIQKDLTHLADAIFQNYKNINDALNRFVPHFIGNDLPIYNVVTTLEDWHLDQLPHLMEYIDRTLRQLLSEAGLSFLVDIYPYKILSTFKFECWSQDIARNGIEAAFKSNKTKQIVKYSQLFPKTLAELMPDIAEKAGLNKFE